MAIWEDWLRRRLRAPVRTAQVRCSDCCPANVELRELLRRRIAPQMAGYAWDGAYTWVSHWEADRSRRVVRLALAKGGGAIVQWGRGYDFLPVLSGDRRTVSYQRTEKAVGIHLFMDSPWSASRAFSRCGKDLRAVEETLSRAFDAARPAWEGWFRQTEGLENAVWEARRQCGEAPCVWPAPRQVSAFLLAALGRETEARQALEDFFAAMPDLPAEGRTALEKRLSALSRAAERGEGIWVG